MFFIQRSICQLWQQACLAHTRMFKPKNLKNHGFPWFSSLLKNHDPKTRRFPEKNPWKLHLFSCIHLHPRCHPLQSRGVNQKWKQQHGNWKITQHIGWFWMDKPPKHLGVLPGFHVENWSGFNSLTTVRCVLWFTGKYRKICVFVTAKKSGVSFPKWA